VRAPAAGAFGAQIRRLRNAARGAVAVAVRTDEFPKGALSVEAVEALTKAGGHTIRLDKATLRALIAYRAFQPAFAEEHVQAWKRSKRPIASLPLIAKLFAVDQVRSDHDPPVAGNGAATHASGDSPPRTAAQPRRPHHAA
jgi:hypothetical protein